jgi:hypothetical protein
MEHNYNTSIFKTGDLVVGSSDPNKSVYSDNGTKLIPDGVAVYGNKKDIERISSDFTRSVTMHGGVLVTAKNTTTSEKSKSSSKKTVKKKIKNTPPVYSVPATTLQYQEEEEEPVKPQLLTVQFENSFGKIKAKVEYVVENELAFMLIFSNEDAMVFEPKIGETLLLYTPNKIKYEVYFPGVIFNSPEDSRRFMVLFKTPNEEI